MTADGILRMTNESCDWHCAFLDLIERPGEEPPTSDVPQLVELPTGLLIISNHAGSDDLLRELGA